MIKKVISNMDVYLYYVYRMICKFIWILKSRYVETKSEQILFRTYQDGYACNPKYLCEELIKTNLPYKIVWVYSRKTENDLAQFPTTVELVKFGSYAYYKAMAESKIWINNAHNFTWEYFPKKSNQILINLWHGSLGLKRINPEADTNKKRQRAGKRASRITDYCVTNSEFEEMVFRTSYWPNSQYLRFGHCRNDIMFAERDVALKMRVAKLLGFDYHKKIALYAPTFRAGTNVECFDIDYKSLKNTLERRFGGEWIILSRIHFQTRLQLKRNLLDASERKEYVIDADNYNDMQELLAVADVGITDYSSWICDFVLTGRPGFLFVTDMDSYVTERGFYYPLENTPFSICRSNDALMKNILSFDEEQYSQKVKRFLKEMGCYEDGCASKKLVKWLENVLHNE